MAVVKHRKSISIPIDEREEFDAKRTDLTEISGKSFSELVRVMMVNGEYLTSAGLSHAVGRELQKSTRTYILVPL